MLTVTVAICTKDNPSRLRRCLTAMATANVPSKDILVVDNNSATGETREIASQFGVAYALASRPGLSAARNQAIASSAGEIIAFVDDDCQVQAGWLDAIRDGFSDPSVGCVVGRAISHRPNAVQHQFDLFARGWCVDRPVLVEPSSGTSFRLPNVIGVGANMAIRRVVLLASNGFPERLASCGDDYYIFLRSLRLSWSLLYRPDSLVFEEHRATVRDHVRRMLDYGYCTTESLACVASEEPQRWRVFALSAVRIWIGSLRSIARSLRGARWIHAMFAAAHFAGVNASLLSPGVWNIVRRPPRHAHRF